MYFKFQDSKDTKFFKEKKKTNVAFYEMFLPQDCNGIHSPKEIIRLTNHCFSAGC